MKLNNNHLFSSVIAKKLTFYNLSFFFCKSASINLNTESKSSAKKFDIVPVGFTLRN